MLFLWLTIHSLLLLIIKPLSSATSCIISVIIVAVKLRDIVTNAITLKIVGNQQLRVIM